MLGRLTLVTVFTGLTILFETGPLVAQGLILNGWYDCQRATNGRAYCKRQGTNNYQSVSEEFFLQYESARTGRPPVVAAPVVVVPQQPVVVVPQTQQVNNTVIVQLQAEASELRGQISLLTKVLEEQAAIKRAGGDQSEADENIKVIDTRLSELKRNFKERTTTLSKYVTSIKPDDAEMQITARRESEIYPKIPYYIPGTKEIGEFWVEPYVGDNGTLVFKFQFVDVASTSANKIRSTIFMTPEELGKTQAALVKAAKNSRLAHEKKVRRKIDVRMDCFPSEACPAEGKKIPNQSSTEIIFSINEDGSTSARIQRNKGLFEEGYNVSISSARLLQAYINHVLVAGKTEHEIGSASTDELKAMFR